MYIWLMDYIWIIFANVLNHQRLYGSIVHVYVRTQLVGGFQHVSTYPSEKYESVGIMIFPTGKIQHDPNHQPDDPMDKSCKLWIAG